MSTTSNIENIHHDYTKSLRKLYDTLQLTVQTGLLNHVEQFMLTNANFTLNLHDDDRLRFVKKRIRELIDEMANEARSDAFCDSSIGIMTFATSKIDLDKTPSCYYYTRENYLPSLFDGFIRKGTVKLTEYISNIVIEVLGKESDVEFSVQSSDILMTEETKRVLTELHCNFIKLHSSLREKIKLDKALLKEQALECWSKA